MSFCRLFQLFTDAYQPAAAVFFLARICDYVGLTAAEIEGYAVRQSAMLDALGENFEYRCTSECHHPLSVTVITRYYPWQSQFEQT